jgi:hypothetical protein
MKSLDTEEGILGHDFYESNVCDEQKVFLSIPEGNLRLMLLNYSDDLQLSPLLRELVHVYEMVRQGKI